MSDDEDIPILIESTTSAPEATDNRILGKVPLTIVTGFLGAGKSTLLNYILTEKHGFRIAVIMNEFGDTADIEARTIGVSSGDNSNSALSEEFLEVANGCLCCSVKDVGAASIEKLMKKRGKFDYILLETTGLADPGPIASIFWNNEDLSEDIRLDGVVCVVDGVFGLKQIDHDKESGQSKEFLRQLACSDIILLNKADITPPTTLEQIESSIHLINPTAPIERTVRGAIDLNKILGLDAYSTLPTIFEDTSLHAHQDHVHDENCKTDHLNDISSLLIPIPVLSNPQLEVLDEWIRSILWDKQLVGEQIEGLEVLRCKGVYSTKDGRTIVLQGVQELYDTKEVSGSGAGEDGKIVLIGRGLSERVRANLNSVLGKYE
ncbi:hypothetical protein FRC02_005359 [Tulasnella sp. 418]|nr:hypothetical protein FRC02_005359 [Tulasnella sp. 418]